MLLLLFLTDCILILIHKLTGKDALNYNNKVTHVAERIHRYLIIANAIQYGKLLVNGRLDPKTTVTIQLPTLTGECRSHVRVLKCFYFY